MCVFSAQSLFCQVREDWWWSHWAISCICLSPPAFSTGMTSLPPFFFTLSIILFLLVLTPPPFDYLCRSVQSAPVLGGLQAAPAVQCGPEWRQPQSAAVIPSPLGTSICPHCLWGTAVILLTNILVLIQWSRVFNIHTSHYIYIYTERTVDGHLHSSNLPVTCQTC